MNLRKTLLGLGLAAFAAAPLAGAGQASAQAALQLVPDTTDSFRTGGCSGCFATQMNSVLAQFSSIQRVFRLCAAGGAFTSSALSDDNCAGGIVAGKSRLQDHIVIQGTLKDSNACGGLGQPGGGTATIRVASSGSNVGIRFAGNNQGTGGFLAPEGFDGVPNTADDAGGTGVFGAVGDGVNFNTSAMSAAPLKTCDAKLTGFLPYSGGFGAAGPAGSCGNPTAPTTQLCVVNFDLNNNLVIDGAQDGAAAPGAITSVGGVAGNEATNLAVVSDMGFADLPTADFEDPTLAADAFRNGDVFGAQIFKLVVNKNIAAKQDITRKLTLADPQIENLFAPRAQTNSVCSWDAVGGQRVDAAADTSVTVCYREFGSGTRETFRNTFMLNAAGSKAQGTTSAPGSGNCGAAAGAGAQRVEGGGNKATSKTFVENPTGGDTSSCIANNANAIGYVDVARTNANWYAVPLFGVDPDSAGTTANTDLRTLVKCGMYPYWGPLSGGDGGRNSGSNVFGLAHRNALKSLLVYPSGNNYIPLGTTNTGVSFTKTRTDGAYGFKFIPSNCPGFPSAPNPKP